MRERDSSIYIAVVVDNVDVPLNLLGAYMPGTEYRCPGVYK